MSFWKKFGGGLKKGAAIALPIAGIVNPALAPAIGVITNAILTAEKTKVSGAEKAIMAQGIVADASPAIIAWLEQASGKEMIDEKLFSEGMKDLQEATVKLLNAFGQLPKR